MSGDDIKYEVDDDGVGQVVLDRPRRRNAFTLEMIDAWAAALRAAAADGGVRVVVVRGAGEAFCAGIDLDVLRAVEETPLARKRMLTEGVHQVARAMEALDKPVIAAVNGVAVGAGLDMALMCDLRFAARTAKLSEGYIRLGLVPGDGGCWLLPRLVGPARALELLLSGDFVDAEEAYRIGLVNRVYEPDELLEQTLNFARRLASHPPLPMGIIKRAVYQFADVEWRTSLDRISSDMALVQSTDDFRESLAAFLERRPGQYAGR